MDPQSLNPPPSPEDLEELVGGSFIARIEPRELEAYRRLYVALDALEYATYVPLEHSIAVFQERLEFWDHIWDKYQLVPGREYYINPHTGDLYGFAIIEVVEDGE